MLKQLKSYNNSQEIFTDLDLEENEMQALIDIFERYWKFEYDQEEKNCYTPKPWKNFSTHRLEETYRGINFVIWTYSTRND